MYLPERQRHNQIQHTCFGMGVKDFICGTTDCLNQLTRPQFQSQSRENSLRTRFPTVIMATSIQMPAVSSPLDSSGISVTKYYSEICKSSLVLAPPTFEFSGDPQKLLGEMAEKKVIDFMGTCVRDIPGLEILCFHGVRVIGSSPNIIREVDQCCFLTYKGRHCIFVMEVKCNADIKKSGGARKKAITQLTTFREMLSIEANVPPDKISVHAVWPNMDPTDPCARCGGEHDSLYEKPKACRQPGTQAKANPEPKGFHVFKDKFEGNGFSLWVMSKIIDASLALDEDIFNSVLDFVARHCVGVLHDQNLKNFCILGDEQAKLVKMPEQPLNEPTIIYGLAGTGKTISIMARIQHISKKLTSSSKALYISFEANTIEMVKQKLMACNIDLTNITFAEFSSLPHNLNSFTQDDQVVVDLVSDGYRYIYLDSVEDAGIDWVNKLLERTLASSSSVCPTQQGMPLQILTRGDFWITFDPFQGLQDSHCLHRGMQNQLHWRGNLVDVRLLERGFNFKSKKFVKLQECFRMPHAMFKHINSKKLLPTEDFPKAQEVESLGVIEVNIELHGGFSIQWLADQLAEQLNKRLMRRGIHPGHCAVLFDQGAADILFPPADGGLPAFVQLVNSELNSMVHNKTAGCMLQISQDMGETILYDGGSHQNTTNSAEEDTAMFVTDIHTNNLTNCPCKAFIGSVASMKGNEARVVLYLQTVDQLQDGEVTQEKQRSHVVCFFGLCLLSYFGLFQR